MAGIIAFFWIFCLFFATVTGAPTGHDPQDACADVRNSALEFNRKAKIAANWGLIAPKGIMPFSPSVAWMEAQDMCDPGTLRHTPEPCMKKMLDVLTSYKSYVKTVAGFEVCEVARNVTPVLHQLHTDMSKCVRSRMDYHYPHKAGDIIEKAKWEKRLQCKYAMERLFSFSILTARVFSVGDPMNHAEPNAANCAHRY